jgi:hypothetical protein
VERTQGAVRIDAQADAPLTALPEPDERVLQERAADAPTAPRPPREEDTHPAAPVAVRHADRARRDLVTGTHDAPERRVELFLHEMKVTPLVELAPLELPVVGEGLLLRRVERMGVAVRVERTRDEPLRPLGPRRLGGELGPHLAEHAHGLVAELGEQPPARLVRLGDPALDPARAA